jgi:hypothetical protein
MEKFIFVIGATLGTFLMHWFLSKVTGTSLRDLYKFYFEDETSSAYFSLLSLVGWGAFYILMAGLYYALN